MYIFAFIKYFIIILDWHFGAKMYNRLYIPLLNQGVYNNLGYPTVKVLSSQEWNLYLFCIKHKYQQENLFFHPL